MSPDRIQMQLQCPMPKLDFEVITLGHGSGGILTSRLLESSVFNLLGNPKLNKKHDGASLQIEGRVAFSTDSFVVSPISFPGGSIGDLAVNGTVNDLAMCGAEPKYLSLSLIIEEGLTMEELWKILVDIKFACKQAGVEIVTGDTKVVERGKGDKLFINTSGLGSVHEQANIDISRVEVGDKIIVSNRIADHGVAIMSQREGLEFESEIESDTRPLNHLVKALIEKFGEDIHLLRDPTRGGIGTVLAEISRDARLGIDIEESQIPINSQVRAACELLGLDPIYVANEGIFLCFAPQSQAEAIRSHLSTLDGSSSPSIVGEVVADHPGQVVLSSGIGGRRVVNMLVGQQLPRIC